MEENISKDLIIFSSRKEIWGKIWGDTISCPDDLRKIVTPKNKIFFEDYQGEEWIEEFFQYSVSPLKRRGEKDTLTKMMTNGLKKGYLRSIELDTPSFYFDNLKMLILFAFISRGSKGRYIPLGGIYYRDGFIGPLVI